MAGREQNPAKDKPNVLVVDVGGSNVKLRTSADHHTAKFKSGKTMTASDMAERTRNLTAKWKYDVVSIGFPGPVVHGRPKLDPVNLAGGWTRFDFEKIFRKPVKLINDAAMQALGSYQGGRMLFLGLGTGLGSALIVDDVIVPLELGEIRYSGCRTLKDVLGKRGLKKLGRSQWAKAVAAISVNLQAAFTADYVMLGGGNVSKLKRLPPGARRGSNRHAFRGGVRLWQQFPITAKVKKHTLIIT